MSINLKIFSTHRIDKKCNYVRNEVYEPIRCGAIFDKESSDIIGDNTGDNISHKRLTYCELTTQYWAWKNIEADYYGFCHYRRYFSFNENTFDHDPWQVAVRTYFDTAAMEELVVNPEIIRKYVSQYDMVVPNVINLNEVGFESVYDQYARDPHLHGEDLDLILNIIQAKYPQYYEAASSYIFGNEFYPFNMFIMKKELFQEYNEFLFGVLDEFDKQNALEFYSVQGTRTPGHLGERLLGVFLKKLQMCNTYRIGTRQVVFYQRPEEVIPIVPLHKENSINVVLETNDYCVPYCAATIQSMIDCRDAAKQYELIVFGNELSEISKNRLLRLIQGENGVSLRIFELADYINEIKNGYCLELDPNNCFPLYLPLLLKHYSKVLYLGIGSIVKEDISILFETDISDYAVAAVVDVPLMGSRVYSHPERIKNLFIPFKDDVMLFNIDAICKQDTMGEIISYALCDKSSCTNKTEINCLYENNVKWLDDAWNVFNDDDNSEQMRLARYAPKHYFSQYQASFQIPKIICYSEGNTPLDNPNCRFSEEFWLVLRKTVYYELALQRMAQKNQQKACLLAAEYDSRSEEYTPSKSILRRIVDVFLPIHSQRKEFVKKAISSLLANLL